MLQREGVALVLLVRRDRSGQLPEVTIPYAQLHADPWYLIDALRNSIAALGATGTVTTPTGNLLKLLLGDRLPAPSEGAKSRAGLNPEQLQAVARCSSNTVWFVWGPPGTGKTTTLGSVVADAMASNSTLLVAAHSNVAVDAALIASVRALGGTSPDGSVVRAGHAVLPEARATHLATREIALKRDPGLRRQLSEVTRVLNESRGTPLASNIEKWRKVMAELRLGEEALLRSAQVVFATLSRAVVAEPINGRTFDAAIVDEVSMTYPAQVVVAASLARRRLSVFGDFRQLPPIVQSQDQRARARLEVDVFTACRVDSP